jgi:cytochrome c biogenesis factor
VLLVRRHRRLDVPAGKEASPSPGDELEIGEYRIEYLGGDIEQGPNHAATVANLTVRDEGGKPYRVRPERRFYPSGQEQTTSEVGQGCSRTYAILEGSTPSPESRTSH